jgi:hypothetical protein
MTFDEHRRRRLNQAFEVYGFEHMDDPNLAKDDEARVKTKLRVSIMERNVEQSIMNKQKAPYAQSV